MYFLKRIFVFLIIINLVCLSLSFSLCLGEDTTQKTTINFSKTSTTSTNKGDFYKRKKGSGFYFYEKEQEPVKKKKKKSIPKKVTIQPKHQEDYFEPIHYSDKELWEMHPKVFKKHYQEALEYAVQHITRDNIEYYNHLTYILNARATAFASAVSFVALQNSNKDTPASYTMPTAYPTRTAMNDIKSDTISNEILNNKKNFGLLVFVSQNCKYCERQKQIYQFFTDEFNWDIAYIDIHHNPQIAQKFNIKRTPTTILVHRETKKHIILATGSLAYTPLKKGIYKGMRYLKGDTDPRQYDTYQYEEDSVLNPLKNHKDLEKFED